MAAVTFQVILEPKKIKSACVSTFFPYYCHEVMAPDTKILVFRMFSFKPEFWLPLHLPQGAL